MKSTMNNLPRKIQIRIMQHSSGVGYFAELPQYGVFTEADSQLELDNMINDLIYELFDVPKSIQNKVRYVPSVRQSLPEKVRSLLMMGTPDIFRNSTYAT